jgi:aspartate/methionine/tyrosine aminotransferase
VNNNLKLDILPSSRELLSTNSLLEYSSDEAEVTLTGDIVKKFHSHYSHDENNTYSDYSILFANGSTQVIHAILHTIARIKGRQIRVGYSYPYYHMMNDLISNDKMFSLVILDSNDLLANNMDVDVEIVTTPNNPKGTSHKKKSNARYIIYDRAYSWPWYTSDYKADLQQEEIVVYTSSKLFGMGGIRIGWCFIKEGHLADEIKETIHYMSIDINRLGLYIVRKIMTMLNASKEERVTLHEIISKELTRRRSLINEYLTVMNTNGPYAWIYEGDDTERGGKGNITVKMKEKYNIVVCPGSRFGTSECFARLSLISSDEVFEELIKRISPDR